MKSLETVKQFLSLLRFGQKEDVDMYSNSRQQSGFSIVEGIIAVVVIAVLGFIGWRLYSSYSSKPTIHKTATNTSTNQPSKTNITAQTSSIYTDLALSSGTVHFQVPRSWIVTKTTSTGDIRPSISVQESCLDYAGLIPPDKPTTIYGNGTEYFTVKLFICPLPSNQTIQQWFEGDYGDDPAESGDQYSTDSINGYSTYYIKRINNSATSINYAFGAYGKAVLITAVVYEVHYNPYNNDKIDATMDVTRYIPDIQSIAKSVSITQ